MISQVYVIFNTRAVGVPIVNKSTKVQDLRNRTSRIIVSDEIR